ncbi:MAG: hypothetical protein EXR29_04480 [Betaproteobacteria bacterium]|nr:hypothetical protein [Betaproteobacteria bacterium]
MSEDDANEGLKAWTHVIYALHAFSVMAGVVTPVFVVTSFLLGWPSIIAVILNYVKRSEAAGTPLESHFRWQIRTFWFAALWCVAGGVLSVTLIGIPLAFVLWVTTGIWVAYRVIRGWLALLNAKPLPV